MKGVRWINGKEYLLAGRFSSRESAATEKDFWIEAKIIKLGMMDFALYQHGGRK